MGYRPDNPAGDALGQALGRQQTVVQHMRASQAAVTTKRAFEFLVLTAARSGSGRALAILHDVQRLSDGTGLVFRSPRGKPLSDMTLPKLIKELGIPAVPHGFRSSFRDWAAERTSPPARWSRPRSPIRYRTPRRRPTRAVISSSAGAA